MSLRFKKFVEDRNYALAKLIYVGVLAIIIFAIYHVFLIVSEAKSWDTAEQYPGTTISVQGEAEVFAVPDVATFSFSVEAMEDSVEDAQEDSAEKINAITEYLEEEGIEDKDVKTLSYNAYPQYSYTPCFANFCESERVLDGYKVTQQIQVKVRDTEVAGEILSGIGSRGVTNVSGLRFEVDDTSKLEAEARSEAIASAKEEAKRLAKDLGVDLKGVVSFSEDNGGYSPEPYMRAESAMMDGADSKITPNLPTGENKITSRVYVVYEID